MKHLTAKKILAGISISLASSAGLLAQSNTSYNANSIPIGGFSNQAFGVNCLTSVTTGGNYNVGIGQWALVNNTTGSENVAVGGSVLGYNNGSRNTGGGYAALGNNSSGTGNTAIGRYCFITNTTGSNNTAIGVNADAGSSALSNAAAIGANAKVMNSNHMILGDNSVNVGIGLSGSGTGPQAKLHAVGTSVAVRGDATGTGVAGNGTGSGGVGFMTGVAGRAYDGATNSAGWFQARRGGNGAITYGVYSEVIDPLGTNGVGYAIYGSDGGSHTSGAGPSYAGYFNGDVVTPGGFYFFSDKRIKKNIVQINNSLDIIGKLNPVNYTFDRESNPSISLPSEKQYGFISQEVQEILPEFTKTLIHPAKIDENGKELVPAKEVLGLNYNGFIALLTKGIQEQQQLIEAQQGQINDLRQQLSEVVNTSSGATGINQLNTSGFEMSQNEPNPFTHETKVNYNLPQTIQNAHMAVYDLSGKEIATFPIEQKGAASITITSEKLAAGIYIYAIVADGKVMDSKKMIVAGK